MLIGSFLEEDDAATRRLVDVNVHGVLNGMKLVLPGMVERGRGHLVNVSSSLGRTGLSHAATYCGSKFFVYGVERGDPRRAARHRRRGLVRHARTGADRPVAPACADSRAARDVGPEEVAAEIVSALRRPRFDVYVPRSIGPLTTFNGVLPRSARDALRRTLKVDTRARARGSGAPRGYELRAAQSTAAELADARQKRRAELPARRLRPSAARRARPAAAAAAERPAPAPRGARGRRRELQRDERSALRCVADADAAAVGAHRRVRDAQPEAGLAARLIADLALGAAPRSIELPLRRAGCPGRRRRRRCSRAACRRGR